MKLLKSPHGLLSLLLIMLMSFFSIDSHSIAGGIRYNGTKNGENCGMKSSNGSASELNEINCMLNPESCLHNAAWYEDRDNSMSPVSTKEGVGAAMATFWTLNGFTQGIQVCPGVYLATAHGVLDDPRKARKENRSLREPVRNSVRVAAYPINPKNVTRASQSNSQFVSPRINNPSVWDEPSTDYVFVKVDKALRPNHFVRPVRSSNKRIVNASRSGEIDVHFYRPQTRFNTDSSGTPDFNPQTLSQQTGNDIADLYQSPLRVNEPCELLDIYWSFGSSIRSYCPVEWGVSGSPNIATINGEDYLVGLQTRGDNRTYSKSSRDNSNNSFVVSSKFCNDYKSVCGQPCAELDEVLQ